MGLFGDTVQWNIWPGERKACTPRNTESEGDDECEGPTDWVGQQGNSW